MPTCVPFGAFPPRRAAADKPSRATSARAASLLGGNAPNGKHVGTSIMSHPLKTQPNLETIAIWEMGVIHLIKTLFHRWLFPSPEG